MPSIAAWTCLRSLRRDAAEPCTERGKLTSMRRRCSNARGKATFAVRGTVNLPGLAWRSDHFGTDLNAPRGWRRCRGSSSSSRDRAKSFSGS